MPHESTVDHEDYMSLSDEELETTQICPRSRASFFESSTPLTPIHGSIANDTLEEVTEEPVLSTPTLISETNDEKEGDHKLMRIESVNLPHARAATPKELTHHHDEDDSDESSIASDVSKANSRSVSPNTE